MIAVNAIDPGLECSETFMFLEDDWPIVPVSPVEAIMQSKNQCQNSAIVIDK